jgi:hypothetical protein
MPSGQNFLVVGQRSTETSNIWQEPYASTSMLVAVLYIYIVFIIVRCIDKIIIVAGYTQHIKPSTQSGCWPARTTRDWFTSVGRSRSTKTDWRRQCLHIYVCTQWAHVTESSESCTSCQGPNQLSCTCQTNSSKHPKPCIETTNSAPITNSRGSTHSSTEYTSGWSFW